MSSRSLATPFLVVPRETSVPGQRKATMRGRRHQRPGASLWGMLHAAYLRHRSRVMLARLDETLLKDIGVSYAEAEYEANKPFWQA
jgi:uncharacterized protein YjiS (DUF1127 family)